MSESERKTNVRARSSRSMKYGNRQLEKRRKQKNITVGFAVLVIIIVVLGIASWKSLSFAEAICEWLNTIIGGSAIVITIIGGIVIKKYKRLFMVISAILIIFSLNGVVAKGYLGEKEKKSQEEITNVENTTKSYEKFHWEEDIYIVDIGKYEGADTDDNKTRIKRLILRYAKQYVSGESYIEEKTDDELNGGIYGEHIDNAKGYETDFNNAKMSAVKEVALNGEIKERELANEEQETFDNLKILGDKMRLKIKSGYLLDDEKEGALEDALRYYIKALPLAYWDEAAGNESIREIWKSIRMCYAEIYSMDGVDSAHRERAVEICEVCKELEEYR